MSQYQKGKNQEGKTNLDLLEQGTVSGSGICWATCKSAPIPSRGTGIGGAGWASAHPGKNQGGHGPPWKF